MLIEFHGDYSQEARDVFKEAQKKDLNKICEYLEIDMDAIGEIGFQIYDTREGKQKGDPNHSISRASARFDEMTVYRFWEPDDDPHFPHETTHLVSHKWAVPYSFTTELSTADGSEITKEIEMLSTSFMQEGLAIAVDDIVFDRTLLEEGEHKSPDDWCRMQSDQLPPSLVDVINLEGFGSLPNKVVVPFSASFSKYLLQECGVEKYKQMYAQLKETDSPKENVGQIEKAYESSEQKLLQQWRDSIGI